MNNQFKKRVQGFLWHGGAMVIVFYLDYLLEKSSSLNLSSQLVMLIGLVVPQITKHLRNVYINAPKEEITDSN